MAIDGVSCQILAKELNHSLLNARLDKIHQPERYTLVLQFRQARENIRLVLSANPSGPAVYPLTDAPANPPSPPNFCMFLRKHLSGANVLSVSSPDLERMIVFHFGIVTELGDQDERRLIIELMGRHSNIIVTNRDRVILESLVHVDEAMSRVREVMPARPYVMPPAQNKLMPDEALSILGTVPVEGDSMTDWMVRLAEAGSTPDGSPASASTVKSNKKVKDVLLQQLQGFSPQLCRQVAAAADIDPQTTWETVAEDKEARLRLKDELTRLMTDIQNQKSSPCLLFTSAADLLPVDTHAYSLAALGHAVEQESYLEALQLFHSRKVLVDQFKQKQRSLESQVEQRLQRSLRRAENLRADLADSEDADLYQRYGELLLASVYTLKGKHSEAEVIDYYDPEQKTVTIPLDPRFDAQTNAQRYFKKATRLRKGEAILIPELNAEEANISYLRDLLNLVQTAESSRELEDLRVEVDESPLFTQRVRRRRERAASSPSAPANMPAGRPAKALRSAREAQYLARQKDLRRQRKDNRSSAKKSGKGQARPQALPPRQYKTSDGFTVLAGRSNLQNDQLTMRTASKTDLWFHVQRDAGTHVILRTEGKTQDEIPDRSILEAAGIAAWFSRGNKSMQAALQVTVPVDYCPISHVRKPRGAKPGFVIYDNHRTVSVTAFDPEDLRQRD